VDGGVTWFQTDSVPFRKASNVFVEGITIDPFRARTLYAGARGYIGDQPVGGGVFKSTDGGNSWFASGSGLFENTEAVALAVDPSNGQTIYAGDFVYGVFRSGNGGARWRSTVNGMTDFNIEALAIDPSGVLYAATDDGLFKSTNRATSWSVVPLPLFDRRVNALAINRANPAIIYAGTEIGVVRIAP
jgi:hypothetical protein